MSREGPPGGRAIGVEKALRGGCTGSIEWGAIGVEKPHPEGTHRINRGPPEVSCGMREIVRTAHIVGQRHKKMPCMFVRQERHHFKHAHFMYACAHIFIFARVHVRAPGAVPAPYRVPGRFIEVCLSVCLPVCVCLSLSVCLCLSVCEEWSEEGGGRREE